ncbi:MAG: hypothetical protein JO149_04935 [Gammaproteobacteria bacterium]|nr:hypothetical protein [Gammaproteobacteria bacterium]
MKRYFAILFIFFASQVQANNVPASHVSTSKAPLSNLCYHQPTTCQGVFNCGLGCQADFAQIVAQFQTMLQVWQVAQDRLGGSWTVVQTPGANWYTNAGIAAICTCPNYSGETIFVQQ